MLSKFSVLFPLVLILFTPVFALCGALKPCTVVATANANTLIQAPSYSQYIPFVSPAEFASCYENDPTAPTIKAPTTATIIVANPPQNPPPTAPVYMSLNTTDKDHAVAPQVLLPQGSTVITSGQFPTWFPGNDDATSFIGVTIYSPGTPWVPASITIIWQ